MFGIAILTYIVVAFLNNSYNISKRIKVIPIKIHIIFILIEILSVVHGNFFQIGENMVFNKKEGELAINRLFYGVKIEGWLGYIIILVILLFALIFEYGGRKVKLNWKYNVGLILVTIVGMFLTNIINMLSVNETCGLECHDFSNKWVNWISDKIMRSNFFWYDDTNVIIPMALTIYVVIMISLCIPRMDETEKSKSIKKFKILNVVALTFMIYYFAYDMFLAMESWSYASMIVVSIVVQTSLVSLEKKK